jgi:glycosyltransferase involved in cell wall biosynthesis
MSESSAKRQRVLVLEGTGRIGGGQKVTIDLISQLQDRFEFIVAVPEAGPLMDELRLLDISVHVLPYPAPQWKFSALDRLSYLPRGLAVMRRVVRLVRESRADMIYATSRTSLWAAMAGRLTGKPVVMHLHLIPPTARTSWFLGKVASMRPVKRALVASPAIAQRLPSASKKIVATPNGVDILRFKPQPGLRGDVKTELGLTPATHLAVVIGEVSSDKGQDDAVMALRELVAEGRNVALLIVGEAREASRDFSGRLKALTQQVGVEDRVIFTGHRSDVRRFLAGADIALVPSKGRSGEACPMAVLEAWACGVPVVAAATGGIPVMLQDSRGVQSLPGDAKSLANAWRSVMDDTELAERLSWAGLAAARGEYSLQSAAERAGRAFDEAMAA